RAGRSVARIRASAERTFGPARDPLQPARDGHRRVYGGGYSGRGRRLQPEWDGQHDNHRGRDRGGTARRLSRRGVGRASGRPRVERPSTVGLVLLALAITTAGVTTTSTEA